MRFLNVVFILFLAGCGSIEQSQRVNAGGSEVGGILIAGLGDTLLEIKKEESMPNAYGKADIFGRKRATGVTYLVYAGVSDSKAAFYRRDVTINSQKTTMNSSPVVINNNSTSTVNAYSNGQAVSGTVMTTAAPTILPPISPSDEITAVSDILLTVSPGSDDALLVEGHLINVISATENMVSYSIRLLGD